MNFVYMFGEEVSFLQGYFILLTLKCSEEKGI